MLWNHTLSFLSLLLSSTSILQQTSLRSFSTTPFAQFPPLPSSPSMAAATQVLPDGYVPNEKGTHADFTKPIEQSLNDDRHYRLIRLNNDLEVMLIQDPNVDKSAAALDVHVGHLSDPVSCHEL